MKDWKEIREHYRRYACGGCRFEIEELGPEYGPVRPPSPRVERWSMTPAEWAGGWL